MKRKIPVLFNTKKECSACGACLNACPKQAISMIEDESGFLYPKINTDLCVGCEKCKNVCAFQNDMVTNNPIHTYAAISKKQEIRMSSASGGVFSTIAEAIIEQGGLVCGAAFDEQWRVRHTWAESKTSLETLQGSKYVQSDTQRTYLEAKSALKEGKIVLYSGTPCQVHGLYGFLGRDYENLLTVDVVCHGVPNNKMLADSLYAISKGHKILQFKFRDKSFGWGKNGCIVCDYGSRQKKKILWQSESAYMYYFSKGWICRENCYVCKYTCKHRPGDITLGDYWGIEKVHPEYIGKNGWNEEKGISVIISNTDKAERYLHKFGTQLELKHSEFSLASKGNAQLMGPALEGKRAEIIETYKNGGWQAVEERYDKNVGIRKYSSRIKSLIPNVIKRKIKSVL